MNSEVNFEKRGKLEDHQACPVCGCCVCDGHRCTRDLMSDVGRLMSVFLLAIFLATPVFATEPTAPYSFQTFDVSIPGHPDLFAFPADINDRGEILTNIRNNDLIEAVIVKTKVNRRGKVKSPPVRFACSDLPFVETSGESINKRSDVAGDCIIGGKQVGFVRHRSGAIQLLDFPGADGTLAKGLNDDGLITGQFFGPFQPERGGALSYRFHCWTFNQATNQFTQIDFPVPSTFVDCFAVNRGQEILVRFIIVNIDNETLQQGWALYDNGTWSFPFPPDNVAGPSIHVADRNNQGQAIIERALSDNDGIFLFDDGHLFEIPTPDDWQFIQVGGMNNRGDFVGSYRIEVGFDPIFHVPIFERHGFLATPRY